MAWRGGRVAVRVPLPQQSEPGISMGKYLVILFGRRSRHRRSPPHTHKGSARSRSESTERIGALRSRWLESVLWFGFT